jgi:hypothetical protein
MFKHQTNRRSDSVFEVKQRSNHVKQVKERVRMNDDQINSLVQAIESLEYSLILLFDKDGEVMKQKIKRDLAIMEAQWRAS